MRGRGGPRGGGSRGGGRGGRGGGRPSMDMGPPASVIEVGTYMHAAEQDMVCKSTLQNQQIPFFNTPAYLENKQKIGMIDEIFGAINDVMFSIKPDGGIKATSFKEGDKVYINPEKTLPLSKFLNEGTSRGGRGGRGRGGAPTSGFRGAARGGSSFRGGSRGRGAPSPGGFRGKIIYYFIFRFCLNTSNMLNFPFF